MIDMTQKEYKHQYYLKNKERWKKYRKQGNFNLEKRKEWMKVYSKKYREEHLGHYEKYNGKKYSLIYYYKNRSKLKEVNRVRAEKYIREKGISPPGKRRGENHHNWKGGITPLYSMIRNCFLDEKWRKEIFERDNHTCQHCFQRGGNLEAHHSGKMFAVVLSEFLKEYNQFSPIEDKETLFRLATKHEQFWDINNGLTLCKKCHDCERKKDKAIAMNFKKD